MPVWLAWLLPVPAATLGAIAWNAWSGRDRGPADVADTIAAHQRFRAALSSPVHTSPADAQLPERSPAEQDARSIAASAGDHTRDPAVIRRVAG